MRARYHNHHATCHSQTVNLTGSLILQPQSKTDSGHILLPSCCTRHFFLCPTTPRDLAESFYMILTMGSSPSFFFLNKNTNGSTRTLFPDPVTSTQNSTLGSSIHLRPDLAHAHAPSTSIVQIHKNSPIHQADRAIHVLLIVRQSPMKTDW